MEKMNFESKDIKTENIKKIEEIFPSCITEIKDKDGKLSKAIDFEALKQILSGNLAEGIERYEFTWPGKNESILEANRPIKKTLRPCKEESKNWDITENLYIEGDNLDALKLLQESYLGKVKMIYIDPPYNTGSDFIYDDDFKEDRDDYVENTDQVDEEGNRFFQNTETNGRFHSDWCSMIYPRLILARNLLSEDGVIFISIDDNEHANLKKICDEIFGEDNIVSDGAVIVKTEGRRYGGFAKTHDYFYSYAKSLKKFNPNEIVIEGKTFEFEDENGGFNIQDLRNQNARAFNETNRPNLRYPFYVDISNRDSNNFHKVSLEPRDGFIEVYPIITNGYKSVWRWGKGENEKARKNINNICARKGSDSIIRIFEKMRNIKEKPKTVLIGKKYISNKGTKEVKEVLGEGIFDFPKPLGLLNTFLNIGTDKESIIIDFFSGSSTTAHAVMELNAEDGGNRKFIMVQLPEETDEKSSAYKAGYKNICEIGKERIRRAGDKILEDNKDKDGIQNLDVGFRVLKVDSTNMKDVYYKPDEYNQGFLDEMVSNIKEDRTDLDLLFACLLEWGLPLTKSYELEEIHGKKIHNYDRGALVACFEENIDEEIVKEMAKKEAEIVVFRDSSFKTSADKINVEEIFKELSPDTSIKIM